MTCEGTDGFALCTAGVGPLNAWGRPLTTGKANEAYLKPKKMQLCSMEVRVPGLQMCSHLKQWPLLG